MPEVLGGNSGTSIGLSKTNRDESKVTKAGMPRNHRDEAIDKMIAEFRREMKDNERKGCSSFLPHGIIKRLLDKMKHKKEK